MFFSCKIEIQASYKYGENTFMKESNFSYFLENTGNYKKQMGIDFPPDAILHAKFEQSLRNRIDKVTQLAQVDVSKLQLGRGKIEIIIVQEELQLQAEYCATYMDKLKQPQIKRHFTLQATCSQNNNI